MEGSMSKLEEALEIKSLRRVIGAYLNYDVAMDEDIKRWEMSYKKLPHAHQELLLHLPKKYEDLRRCTSENFSFILNMLQAFEPPFDMSQHIDMDEQELLRMERGNHSRHRSGCDADTSTVTESTAISLTLDWVERQPQMTDNSSMRPLIPLVEPTQLLNNGNLGSSRDCITHTDFQEPLHGGCANSNISHDDHQCLDGSSKGSQPHREDARGAETRKNLRSDKKIFICGMDFEDPGLKVHVPPSDVDKVRCIIRNIVRDWTKEGTLEREQCYKPILEELINYFPNRAEGRAPRVVVPGAGLARLACEISCLGFECQGNEFSYFMLICSNFILNNTQLPLEWTIYPWIHSNCNMTSDANQLEQIQFPDLHPGSAGITDGFSMCAGDFVEVYGHSNQEGYWDAVVTCFFIDTAHNVVEYIEIISKVLKPGGVWINLGPLLYHFADAASYPGEEEMSVELSLEDVKKVALHFGLKMQTRYFAAFWTMIKADASEIERVIHDR